MPPHLLRAIIVILLGIAAFDMMSVLVRMLGGSYPILQISIIRNAVGILPALILLLAGPGLSALKKLNSWRHWVIIIIRSAAIFLAQIGYYTALTKIEFATASALAFTSPFFITLLSILILGHHVGLIRIAAILVGFTGVIVILKPFNESFSLWMLLPVVAAFGYGLSSVLVKLFSDDISSGAIQVSQQLVTGLMGVTVMMFVGGFVPVESTTDLGLFVLVGIMGGIGVLSIVVSYRLVDPSSLAPFEYFGIPVSFILGFIFFREAPFSTLFPGVLFIIGAGLLIIIRERRAKQAVTQEQ